MIHSHHRRPHPQPHPSQTALSDLPKGGSGIVRTIRGGKDLAARLASLGITPGVNVSVIQNYGHGPLMIIVRDSRLALGRGEAHKVLVDVQ